MPTIDTQDREKLAGAVYFAVGRGTEGGSASYHLSIAGVTVDTSEPHWGNVGKVADNSGYTLGAIQVDFGQRGTWPVGAISGRKLNSGEQSYVDAVIEQASTYAKQHRLPFTDDLAQLETDLLSHGNGKKGRDSIRYIDTETRDSINAWAASPDGKKWIHHNIDLPQIRNATNIAVDIMEKHGGNVSADRKFEATCILAKAANQLPSQLIPLTKALSDGGGYDELLEAAKSSKRRYGFFDGPKAAAVAEKYEALYANDAARPQMDSAHAKVMSASFDPKVFGADKDLMFALGAVGGKPIRDPMADGVLRQGERGPEIRVLQQKLHDLGYTDAQGKPLVVDDSYGARTKQAVQKFQFAHGMPPSGIADKATLQALGVPTQSQAADDPLAGLNASMRRLREAAGLPEATREYRGMQDYPVPNQGKQARPQSEDAPKAAAVRAAFADGRFNLGDEGIGVERLQSRLQAMGYTGTSGKPIVADSEFGPNTQHAVREFQRTHGLKATGAADLDTLRSVETAVARGERYAPPPVAEQVQVATVAADTKPAPQVQPVVAELPVQPPAPTSILQDTFPVRDTAQLHASLAGNELAQHVPRATYASAFASAVPETAVREQPPDTQPQREAREQGLREANRQGLPPDVAQAVAQREAITMPAGDAPVRALPKDIRDPEHPGNERYTSALDNVRRMEFQNGIASGPHSEKLAVAVAIAVERDQLQVQRLELDKTSGQVTVVERGPYPIFDERRVPIDTRQALGQSFEQSSQQWLEARSSQYATGAPTADRNRDQSQALAQLSPADQAMFAKIREGVPPSVSDDHVAQAMLAAKRDGITDAGKINQVAVVGDKLWIEGTTPGFRAAVDVGQPAPALQDTAQQSQAFNQQRDQQLAMEAQQRVQTDPSQGPRMA